MSSTVAVGQMELTSNFEAAKDMVTALKPVKDKPEEPKIISDGGQTSEEKPDPEVLSKAASELGKKGGEAAAKAREAKAKEPEAKEPEGEEKPAEGEEKPGRAKVRIEELARQRAEERKAREAAEKRASDLEARLARLEQGDRGKPAGEPEKGAAAPQGAPKGNGKPTPDAFDTYEDFSEGLFDYKVENMPDELLERLLARVNAKMAQKAQAEQLVAHHESKIQAFNKRVAEARAKDDGILERVDPRFMDLTPSRMLPPGTAGPANDIVDAIFDSDHGVALMVYLTEHPDEMNSLLQLPDSYTVVRAMGRLEAKVAEMPPPAPKGTSKAPPPVTPLSPNGQAGEPDLLAEVDFDTFYKRAASRRR